jgi:hypothetical protein
MLPCRMSTPSARSTRCARRSCKRPRRLTRTLQRVLRTTLRTKICFWASLPLRASITGAGAFDRFADALVEFVKGCVTGEVNGRPVEKQRVRRSLIEKFLTEQAAAAGQELQPTKNHIDRLLTTCGIVRKVLTSLRITSAQLNERVNAFLTDVERLREHRDVRAMSDDDFLRCVINVDETPMSLRGSMLAPRLVTYVLAEHTWCARNGVTTDDELNIRCARVNERAAAFMLSGDAASPTRSLLPPSPGARAASAATQ